MVLQVCVLGVNSNCSFFERLFWVVGVTTYMVERYVGCAKRDVSDNSVLIAMIKRLGI